MISIKQRRLIELIFTTYPDLYVGVCVPVYFCPMFVMLYMIHMGNVELDYQGGQDNIIYLEFDLINVINWANSNNKRWFFTNLTDLDKITKEVYNWNDRKKQFTKRQIQIGLDKLKIFVILKGNCDY